MKSQMLITLKMMLISLLTVVNTTSNGMQKVNQRLLMLLNSSNETQDSIKQSPMFDLPTLVFRLRHQFDLDTYVRQLKCGSLNSRQHSVQSVRTSKVLGCVMGLRVILARSLSMGSIPIRSTKLRWLCQSPCGIDT